MWFSDKYVSGFCWVLLLENKQTKNPMMMLGISLTESKSTRTVVGMLACLRFLEVLKEPEQRQNEAPVKQLWQFHVSSPKNLLPRILTDSDRFWVTHSILLHKNCWKKKKKLLQSLSYKEAGVRLTNWSADFTMTHVFVYQACFNLYVCS